MQHRQTVHKQNHNNNNNNNANTNSNSDDNNNTYGVGSGNVGFLSPTLEEDMVSKMAPLVTHEGAGINYQPHMPYSDAASLNE